MTKRRKILCSLLALVIISAADRTRSQNKDEIIAGIPVKVISESRDFKTQFVSLVIPDASYSRENLERIWRHYCDKYTDKEERLDVRVYTNRSYEFNHQFDGRPVNMHTGEVTGPNGTRVTLRQYAASFMRTGGSVLGDGDNEMMVYIPNLNEPEKRERVILAGKDPANPYAYIGNRDSDFISAAARGDMAKVKALLAEGVAVDTRDTRQATALIKATVGGKVDIVKMLLDKGADVNARENGGWTALIYAADLGNNEIVELLLNKGADINAETDIGASALARTIYTAKPETLKLLLAKGEKIESKDPEGDTPLMLAARQNPAIVRILLDKGAGVNARNNKGKTPLMQAYEEETVISLLDKGADINAQDNDGYTALMYAIANYNSEQARILKARILISHGADVSIETRKGETALQIARQHTDNTEIVKMLLEAGAR